MAKLKLTEKAVAQLPAPTPTGKQALHWDTELRGFGLLCSGKTSAKTYVVQRELHGRTRRVTVAPANVLPLKEARQRAQEILAEFARGVDPKAKQPASMTLRQAHTAYLASPRLRSGSKRIYRCVPVYLADWLDLPLRAITPDMVEARHASMQAHNAAGGRYSGQVAANLTMALLRAVWNFAAEREPNLPPNPVQRLRRRWFKTQRRTRMVAFERLPDFYAAVCALDNPVQRDLILLLLHTGMRKHEATSLTWSAVDFVRRIITVPGERTKSGRPLVLPMTSFVRDLLVRRRSLGDAKYIFPSNARSGHMVATEKPLAAIAKATGIRISAHDLRRGYCTIAATCVGYADLRQLVGHAGGDVTAGYIVHDVERLRAAAQQICHQLNKLCGIEAPSGETVTPLRGI
jgi:integrase